MDNDILHYWEPGAPLFEERLTSLRYAFEAGYDTSVSAEPMLDSKNAVALFKTLEPYVTDSIWLGKMNHMESRVKVNTNEDSARIRAIQQGQVDQEIFQVTTLI